MNLNIYDLLRSNVALVMNLLLGSVGICITIGTALEARRPLWLLALYIIGKGFFLRFTYRHSQPAKKNIRLFS